MCGICGIFNFKSLKPVQDVEIARMCRVMAYRGPDDHGVMIDGPIGLGHRRLSIIDLAGGHQPMFNDDGSICIVFNGEIYNYLELRETLIKKGWHFRTDSDTEVLIRMYEAHGRECLGYLNGMFAFALWDRKEKRLLLARDRMGEKPLYFAETDDGVVFGSEIKALIQCHGIDARMDPLVIDPFLSFGYTPGRNTIFKGIQKVMPAEVLSVEKNHIAMSTYWDVDFRIGEPKGERYYIDRLNELLDESVRLRLRSDVPVGVFLSGGVDSSAVVATLHRQLSRQVKTFSVSYDKGKGFDESPYSTIVARQFETDHYHFYLSPDKFIEFIPDLVWHLEEPIAEPPAISLYYVSRLAREHVKVVLSGEGADELFAGYPKYWHFKTMERLRMFAPFLNSVILANILKRTAPHKIMRAVTLMRRPLEERYLGGHALDLWYRDSIYADEFQRTLRKSAIFEAVRPYYEKTAGGAVLNRMLYLDQKTWLPDNLLLKADRMSMAASIELRVPFLDHRLVEFAATIPPNLKLKGRQTKYILKKALKSVLPDRILERKKMGFPAPTGLILRQEGKSYLMDVLFSQAPRERGYFNYRMIERVAREHMASERDHSYLLWQLLILEVWHRRFIDKSAF